MKALLFPVVFFLVLLLFLGGWIWLRRFEHAKLYQPSNTIETTPGHYQLMYQEVNFTASDGTALHGWWIPANRPRATVVYCHGNTGNIGTFARYAPEFNRRRLHLLLWDYRGYGRSGGRPSERGLYDDARAAYDAAATLGRGLPVILYGLSLGGAVAANLATERPAAALIIEASYASAADVARRWYPDFPLYRFLSVSFDAAAKVATLHGMPKLFGHSIDDPVIAFQSGRILHGAAAPPKVFAILEGGHNDSSWFTPGAPGNDELEAFLEGLFRR